MQVLSPKPVMEERGASKLWRSRSLPANSRDVITASPAMTRAASLKTTRQACAKKGLFSATKATRPSALLERRKKVSPSLKVEAFNTSSSSSSEDSNPRPKDEPSPSPSPAPDPASKPRTPYEILQISPLASQEDIKTAYWRSALKHHPDKVPSPHRDASTLLFLEIQSAYSTLKDPISRARFDRHLSFQSSGYHHQSSPSTPSSTPRPHSTSYPYSPRAYPTTYPYTPRPHPSSSSKNLYTPRGQATPSYPSSSPNPYSPHGSASSPNYYTPRSPFSIGRNWETDQCF